MSRLAFAWLSIALVVVVTLVGFSRVAVLAVAFGKWRSGRVIEVSDQDLEIADSLRERD